MATLFRYLVAISTVLFVVFWLLPFVDHIWLTENELSLIAADGYGSSIPQSLIIYWIVFITWLVISIGLFFFNYIARTGFVVLIIASTIASFFWGFKVFTPYEAALGNIVSVSDGAIIAIAYLTSVNEKFSRQ